MILAALTSYYDRKSRGDPGSLPPVGFEVRKLSYAIVINRSGNLVNLEAKETAREGRISNRDKLAPSMIFAPTGEDRTSGKAIDTAFLLCDSSRYVLGTLHADETENDPNTGRRLQAFVKKIEMAFPERGFDAGVDAVLAFYRTDGVNACKQHPEWSHAVNAENEFTFRLIDDDSEYVCHRPRVIERAIEFFSTSQATLSPCLVSGEVAATADSHRATRIFGGQATAKLVSFNSASSWSYGRDDKANIDYAPISRSASAKYTLALNHLLGNPDPGRYPNFPSPHCRRVGSYSVVFWAGEKTIWETAAPLLIDGGANDDPDAIRVIDELLSAPLRGSHVESESSKEFFVLALSPAQGRIAVKAGLKAKISDVLPAIRQHLMDVSIVSEDGNAISERVRLRAMIQSLSGARSKKNAKLPDRHVDSLLRAIYFDAMAPYPSILMRTCLARIRTEQASNDKNLIKSKRTGSATAIRVGLLKGTINRVSRRQSGEKEYLKMSIDENCTDAPYVLGRLFAVYEAIQRKALDGGEGEESDMRRTIREKLFSHAMTSPGAAFARIESIITPYLTKLRREHPGLHVFFMKQLESAYCKLSPSGVPARLTEIEQAKFVVGYYHQRVSRGSATPQPQSH